MIGHGFDVGPGAMPLLVVPLAEHHAAHSPRLYRLYLGAVEKQLLRIGNGQDFRQAHVPDHSDQAHGGHQDVNHHGHPRRRHVDVHDSGTFAL